MDNDKKCQAMNLLGTRRRELLGLLSIEDDQPKRIVLLAQLQGVIQAEVRIRDGALWQS